MVEFDIRNGKEMVCIRCIICEKERHSGHFNKRSNMKLIRICDKCEPEEGMSKREIESLVNDEVENQIDYSIDRKLDALRWILKFHGDKTCLK